MTMRDQPQRLTQFSLAKLTGFTLIELMITVSIAIVLLISAFPTFRQIYHDHALTTQANELLSHINFARSTSILRNSPITLCRTTSDEATTCASGSAAWTSWMVISSNSTVLHRGYLSSSKGLTQTLNTASDIIVFGADGLARVGGSLISSGKRFEIKGNNDDSTSEIRCLKFGAGTRLQIQKQLGSCNG